MIVKEKVEEDEKNIKNKNKTSKSYATDEEPRVCR